MAPTGFPGIDDWPHRSPQALTECFVLTRILPLKTSQEVTHPRITPSQAHLTWKFLRMSYRKGRYTFGDISNHHIPFKPFSLPFRCQVSLPFHPQRDRSSQVQMSHIAYSKDFKYHVRTKH